jgi:hypothetical protein
MKALKYIFVLLFITSCGSFVDYDYEENTDFSAYKTYNYFTDIKTGFSQLDNKRLFAAIDAKLAIMGFTKSENPSFRIDIQSGEIINNPNNVGIGMGGTGGAVGGGVSFGIPVGASTTQREVNIEFVDDSKTGVFWQAVTIISQHANNTPEKREAAFVKMVDKVFSKYPPKQ